MHQHKILMFLFVVRDTRANLGLEMQERQLTWSYLVLSQFIIKQVGVVHIAVGGMHAAALTHDDLIYIWGSNDYGAVGRDTTWERSTNEDMDMD